ncbi:MAG TPA: hypothetical protein VMS73_01680 [Anaerolineaceae bacterium]|nr:hypothetical protein [Anaerolineaceae bacterium]
MNKRLFSLIPLLATSVLVGFLIFSINIGNVGAAGRYYAGYFYGTSSVTGVRANISNANPNIPISGGTSSEWVMAVGSSSSYYTQAGWLKFYGDSAPKYWVEYAPGCGSSCQFRYGTIDSNPHEYKVEVSGSVFCGYIDGIQKACSNGGFTTTSNEQFFGESSDTSVDIGGTQFIHLRMSYLCTKSGATWTQVNTGYLTGKVDSTRYHIDKGFTNPYTWADNWTQ